jgi:hypothetical protein
MTRPTQDPNPTDLAAGYILDDLTPEEFDRLNQALAETPALHREIAAFGEAFALIPYDMPLLEPSANLKAKILSAASHPIADRATPQSSVVPRRNWKRWIPAISTGIAAAAVAALGLNQIQLIALQQQLNATNTELKRFRSELQANQETIALLSQPDTKVYSLIGATSSPRSSRAAARIFAKPGDRTVTMVTQDLPKLPNNQIYRLWAVATPSSAPMYCGQFHQDNSGKAQWVAPNAACTQSPSQLLITLDAPSDPITAAGPLVMRSST